MHFQMLAWLRRKGCRAPLHRAAGPLHRCMADQTSGSVQLADGRPRRAEQAVNHVTGSHGAQVIAYESAPSHLREQHKSAKARHFAGQNGHFPGPLGCTQETRTSPRPSIVHGGAVAFRH